VGELPEPLKNSDKAGKSRNSSAGLMIKGLEIFSHLNKKRKEMISNGTETI